MWQVVTCFTTCLLTENIVCNFWFCSAVTETHLDGALSMCLSSFGCLNLRNYPIFFRFGLRRRHLRKLSEKPIIALFGAAYCLTINSVFLLILQLGKQTLYNTFKNHTSLMKSKSSSSLIGCEIGSGGSVCAFPFSIRPICPLLYINQPSCYTVYDIALHH